MTTIVEKLKLQKYKEIALLNVPDHTNYFEGVTDYQTELGENTFDMIFAFVFDMEALKELINIIIKNNHLYQNGYLYIAYPKKGNKMYPTFIHRDELLVGVGAKEDGYIGESAIKFARMVGLDDVFTVVGLKEDAKSKNINSTKASQYVDDYTYLIPQIEKDLEDVPELLTFYQSLTPGYRKNWARFVYSAKQEVTKEKRREEMKMILSKGYKSRDLYRLEN